MVAPNDISVSVRVVSMNKAVPGMHVVLLYLFSNLLRQFDFFSVGSCFFFHRIVDVLDPDIAEISRAPIGISAPLPVRAPQVCVF